MSISKEKLLAQNTPEQLADLVIEGYETAKDAVERTVEAELKVNRLEHEKDTFIKAFSEIKKLLPVSATGFDFEALDFSKVMEVIQGNSGLMNSVVDAFKIVEQHEKNTVRIIGNN